MANLAATPVAPPVVRKSRRGWITGVAALIVVAVLGASAYGIYASFLRPAGQVESAKYLPDNTLAYVSVDLAAAANNSHHVSFSDFGGANVFGSKGPIGGLGLNWQTDIQPWLGPGVTLAVIPGASGGAMSEVGLLQSHNDAAATAAVQKFLAAQQQHGESYAASTYSGFSLHSAGGNGITVASGTGWVLVSSSGDAIHAVIDRLNGKGSNLYGNASFQRATGNLPADRFGTLYVNLHALTSASSPAAAGTLATAVLSVYPTVAGSLEWTAAGARWQTTLPAAQGGFPAQNVSGNSTDLASLVPSTTIAYAGVANLGGLTQSFAQLLAPTGQATPDPLKAALGIASSDPALQQQAAFALLSTQGGSTAPAYNGVVMIKVATDADASRLLAAFAQRSHLTTRATTVDGVSATQLFSTGSAITAFSATRPVGAQIISEPAGYVAPNPQVVAIEAVVRNTMVIANSESSLRAVIETAKGANASLATAPTFQKLVAGAPTDSAASAFVDVASLQQLLHAAAGAASKAQVTAALLTLTWNNTELQTTLDTALSQ